MAAATFDKPSLRMVLILTPMSDTIITLEDLRPGSTFKAAVFWQDWWSGVLEVSVFTMILELELPSSSSSGDVRT